MTLSKSYRPEIDGLRALAILSVILYHAGIKCPGGYVGVDVFFVISGYLISNLIIRDIELGQFNLFSFWERRFRRIAPALTVVLCVTLVAGGILLLPSAYSELGRSALHQILFAANFYFYNDLGYFASEAEQKPLLHTWSLAVEEQFYLIVPFALLALSRLKRGRKSLTFILLLLSLGSFLYSVVCVQTNQPAAFFLLPSRFWEMSIGSLVALAPCSTLKKSVLKEFASVIGLSCILYSIAFFDRKTAFPGYSALLPVLGTALIIVSNLRGGNVQPPTFCGRLLATPPMVGIGLISYSLYLWHWPIIAFANYWSFTHVSKLDKVLIVLSSFILAFASWKWVEIPFREKRVCSNQKRMFQTVAVSMAVTLVFSLYIIGLENYPLGSPVYFNNNRGNSSPVALMSDKQVSLDEIKSDSLISFGKRSQHTETLAVLWGDSHAMAAFPAFDQVFTEAGISGKAIMHSGVAPLISFDARVPNGTKIDTVSYNRAAFNWIEKHRVKNVILVGYWSVYEKKGKLNENHEEVVFSEYFKSRILDSVDALQEIGSRVYIMLQVPEHKFDPAKAYAFCKYFSGDRSRFLTKPSTWNGLAGEGESFFQLLSKRNVEIIDPRQAFLNSDNNYEFANGDLVFYSDKHHLSVEGARLLLAPVLKDVLLLSKHPLSEYTNLVPMKHINTKGE